MNCIFCGEEVEKGYPPQLPESFMSQQYLQVGECICERCHSFLTTKESRKTSWIIKSPRMDMRLHEEIENPDRLDILCLPPDPPFYLHLTRMKRKHGWIRNLLHPAYNKKRFYITYEEDLIFVDVEKLRCLRKTVQGLRGRGVLKKSLRQGISAGEAYRKQVSIFELKEVERNKKNQLWRMVVDLEQ